MLNSQCISLKQIKISYVEWHTEDSVVGEVGLIGIILGDLAENRGRGGVILEYCSNCTKERGIGCLLVKL